jgi:hypothetical protein
MGMDGAATDCAAFVETVVFLSYFKDLQDPRQRGKVTYPLDEVLLLCLLSVLAGAECFTEIALFGTRKLTLLRRFRPFKSPPSGRRSRTRGMARQPMITWATSSPLWMPMRSKAASSPGWPRWRGFPRGVIAIDGKTVRRSGHKQGARAAIHMVSAFAARQRLVLGQVKVAEKSNEILAIPKLLDMVAIEGAIITTDAIGCQRDIAQKVIDKKADCVLALKGNQGSLRQDVELFATSACHVS